MAATPVPFDLQQAASPHRMVGLWRLMRGFRSAYLGATLALGIASLAKTATYLLLRYFIDTIQIPDAQIDLALMALAFLGLALMEGGFTYISGRLAAYTAEGTTRRLRNYLFDHIQRLSFTYHSKMETGELISRSTSDVDALKRFFADQAIGIGRIFILFGINFAALLSLNTTLALISVIVVPPVVVTSLFFFRRVSKVYESYQEQEATLSTTLQENLTGIRVVKAFARQDHEIQKFDGDNREKYQRGKRLISMHAMFWPISDTLCNFQILAGFLVGALMAIDKQISVGTYLAYGGLIIWLIWPLRNLGRLIVQMSTGQVSYKRVMDIIRETREPLDEGDFNADPEKFRGGLVFNGVGFEYEKGSPVLENISFTVKPGQIIALLGSTGSGKTTLVNLLPRFYEYTHGSILLDGIELNRYPRRFLRHQIGIVEQEPFLFSRSIRDNITYGVGRDIPQEEIEQAARIAAIHEVICSFPAGYETLVGEKGVTLSGGQKQRVAIARTLLKNPRILILDDSTSSVDTETEAEIRGAMQGLMKNRTTFVIAHRISSIQEADLILVMDKGKIVQSGKHDELIDNDGIYRQIYDIQTRIEVEVEKEIASVG